MVINEQNIRNVSRSLHALSVGFADMAKKLEEMYVIFKGITKESDGNVPDDPQIMEAITDTRRQEIYDKCITHAYELLGFTSDDRITSLTDLYQEFLDSQNEDESTNDNSNTD